MIIKIKQVLFFVVFILFGCVSCKLGSGTKDYALLEHRDDWSHHYAYGSPSWDTFERFAGNPVYRGREGMEWPVNGFFYNDPISRNWYLYIGEYRQNYKCDESTSTKDYNCVVLRSSDKGMTWQNLGDLFPKGMVCYDSIRIEAPDVMVTYHQGKYHMVFDWVPDNISSFNILHTGIGYAVADSPEGPFTVSDEPLKHNGQFKEKPMLGRYWRMYAPMLVKRENDWALLYMMDTQPARSWVLALSTASKPEGPYSDPLILFNVEQKTYYPPLMEYYPCFVHDGYVYFPSTSVARNRNHQIIRKVDVEHLHDASKYKIISEGTFWHSENVENEYAGIWGQTFTGFVDEHDTLRVMFPSKDAKDYGTINIAKASWKNMERDKGFKLSAHGEKSFTYLKKIIDLECVDMQFDLAGTFRLVFDHNSPIDVLNGWGRFSIGNHAADYKEIVVDSNHWQINVLAGVKDTLRVGSGEITTLNKKANKLKFRRKADQYILEINGKKCWEGTLDNKPGLIGIALNPNSYLYVDKFIADGRQIKGEITYGFYDALINAGNQERDWVFKTDTLFEGNRGAVSKTTQAFAKWNFEGESVKLYLPEGPDYGTVKIYLDGNLVKELPLNAPVYSKSAVVFTAYNLGTGSHALYIETNDGLLPVNCIKVGLFN